MGRRSEQTFIQRRHTDGQQAHEKMLNVATHQRSTNQNHNEISPHTCQNDNHQKKTHTNKFWQGCEEKGNLVYHWWEYKLTQPLWKTEKSKNRTTMPLLLKSRQSCPTLCDPVDGSPPGSRPWDSPGKNTGVGRHVTQQFCSWVRR